MNELLQFAGEHHIFSISALWVIGGFSFSVIRLIAFTTPNRLLRHLNIRKHGYPPIHCDADGDSFLNHD